MNKLKINWAIRCKSKAWWIAMISATLLLIQTVAAPFGYSWDFVVLNQQFAAVVNAAFALATNCSMKVSFGSASPSPTIGKAASSKTA